MKQALEERQHNGNLRTLSLSSGLTDFFSNDYLGLARNQELTRQVENAYAALPSHQLGSTGSRLLSGNSAFAMELEFYLATLFRAEAVLLFNSGYAANSSLISCVTRQGDTILYDELVHASMREGYRLSFADHRSFRHNNPEDLEKKLSRLSGTVFVLIESVYSMDGDNAHLAQMVEVCEKYGAHIILDEAHSTGIYGEGGNGMACNLGLEDRIFARVYTFGKAIGSHGACVAGSRTLHDYLVNFARGFIFSTAMPLHNMVVIEQAFRYIGQHPGLQCNLTQKIGRFTQGVAAVNNERCRFIESNSAIQAAIVPGNEACRFFANFLRKNGLDVRPILSPTVKAGQERLRICLHTFNTMNEIDLLTERIAEAAGLLSSL